MKSDDLEKYFESVKPSAESKERMLYAILSSENASPHRSNIFKYVGTVAVLLVFACGIAISSVRFDTGDKLVQNTTGADKYEVQTSEQKTSENKTTSENDFGEDSNAGNAVKSEQGALSEKKSSDTSHKIKKDTVKQRQSNEKDEAPSEKKSGKVLEEKVVAAQAVSEKEQSAFSGGGARRSIRSDADDMSDEEELSIGEKTVDSSGTAMLSDEPAVASEVANAEAEEGDSDKDDDDKEKDEDKSENDTEYTEEENAKKDSGADE